MAAVAVASRFEIESCIGRGSSSAVFAGFDRKSRRPVVLKLMPDTDDEAARKFDNEVAILSRLAHPNVIRLIDHGVQDNVRYLVLEQAEGTTLWEYVGSIHPFSVRAATIVAEQCLEALAHVHARGIVHLDLKPGNVIFTSRTGTIKIVDFGIASDDLAPFDHEDGSFSGTMCYAAPEQLQGKLVDERADLYSVGTIFYEIMTGTQAVHGETRTECLLQAFARSFLRPTQLDPRIPPAVDDIVRRALEPDPADRFQTAGEFLAALELFRKRHPHLFRPRIGVRADPGR